MKQKPPRAGRKPDSKSPFARLLRNLLAGTVVLGVIALAVFSYKSWQQESRDVQRNLAIQAGFAAKSSQAIFDSLGISMEMLGQMLAAMDVMENPELARPALLEYVSDHPEIAAVALVSPDGRMLLNTGAEKGGQLPDFRKDAAYLRDFLFDLNNTYAYNIGRNQFGRGLNRWHFPFRHTVKDGRGIPLFVIQAAIPVESAGFLWSDLPLASGSRVGLMRDDGYLQLIWPIAGSGEIFERSQWHGGLMKTLRNHPGIIAGAYEGDSSLGGGKRTGAFSRLPNANMLAFVSVPEKLIAARWWEHNYPILMIFLVYLGVISLIAFKLSSREREHTDKLQALASFPEGSPEIVLSTNSDADITYMNPRGKQVLAELGLGPYEIAALLPRDYREIVARCLLDGATVQTIEVEFGHRYLLWTFSPLKSQGIAHCYGLEITKRRRAEENARKVLVEKQAAEAANQSKSLFLANMSHEIRTPLNGIMGFLRLLAKTQLSPAQREYLDTTEVSAKVLMTVINDILDFSKIEAGKVSLEQIDIDLKTLLNEILSLHSANAKGKGLTLALECDERMPAHLLGDPARISQVLSNLIGNAIKFTRQGGIFVKALLLEENVTDARIEVSVKDCGIGISKEQQALLFQSFSQADASTTRRYGGTGLGLAISKALVELMGGEISVTSDAGHGATFSFTLRMAKQTTTPRSSVKALQDAKVYRLESKEAGGKLSVLVVDDNEINRKLVKILLEQQGASCELAENGAQALDACLRGSYDLILMDVHMPVMDGLEATSRIRELEKEGHRHTPIIALTANALRGDREKYLAAGMDEYLSKPVNETALMSALARLGLAEHKTVEAGEIPSVPAGDCERLLDPALGVELSLNDRDLWRKVLGMLFDKLPEYAASLGAARHNPEELGKIAHKLAGASGYCGTPALTHCAKKLERLAKNGDRDQTATALEALLHQIGRLLALKVDGEIPDGNNVIY